MTHTLSERAPETVLLAVMCVVMLIPPFPADQRASRKMATSEQKAFCVLHFARTESAITVQRAFHIKFGCQPPKDNDIRRWHHQFETTDCLCKGKNTERPRHSEESVTRVRETFLRSPNISVRRASRELAMPMRTVWKVLRKRLELRPYRLHLLQALKPTDYGLRAKFTNDTRANEHLMDLVVFSDESTFRMGTLIMRASGA
ncbi:DUF4817 domain-containing protein [Trichonephila clavipes]|nr:DUF4817 domain-containing protein [Trichonephila clavipes]